jgi:hypothetical protein
MKGVGLYLLSPALEKLEAKASMKGIVCFIIYARFAPIVL